MGRRQKQEKQIESDKKGDARMRKYEKSKEEKPVITDNIRITTFWEKIGKDGSWEEKEYRQKIVKL